MQLHNCWLAGKNLLAAQQHEVDFKAIPSFLRVVVVFTLAEQLQFITPDFACSHVQLRFEVF
jgi:hypothetical protein